MADVASKQQTTALFLSTIVTHEKTHRTDKPDGKPVLCQRTFSSVFSAVFSQLNSTVYLESVWGPLDLYETTGKECDSERMLLKRTVP
jgi:3-methyladenine DNA glycosylase/8-oxoguanine DNA glycosylase